MNNSHKPLAGRLALVTGASRGIGRAVALGLAQAGAHLILVSRTAGALEELDDQIQANGGQPATLVPLDLADVAGIDRLGGAIHERWGKLDILIGNAGYLGDLSPVPHLAPKDWDCNIAINLTANWRLIRSLDPLLRLSDAGRAVFISSSVARKQKPFWGAYAAAKAALEKLVETYAVETAQISALRVNLVNPGPMRTVMRAAAMPGEDPKTLPKPEALLPLIMDLVSPAQTATGQLFDFPEWAAAKTATDRE